MEPAKKADVKPRLLLFDIDGTLVRDGGDARDSFAEALSAVYEFTPPLDRYDFSGRTDPEIAHLVLESSHFSTDDIERKLDHLWEHYLSGLRSREGSSRSEMIEGVASLLERVETEPSISVALLTGNIEQGARFKLGRHDLNRYFSTGAFGSDSAIRSELPPIAVSRAAATFSKSWEPADVFIIGDSIHDVRCGKPHGATSIAVATGRTDREALLAEKPDHFFEDLTDHAQVLDAILGDG